MFQEGQEIRGAAEPAPDGVAGGPSNAQEQRFKFLNVFGVLDDVEAEVRPAALVAVFEMSVDSTLQIAGQADVIELIPAVESVKALAAGGHFGNRFALPVEDR